MFHIPERKPSTAIVYDPTAKAAEDDKGFGVFNRFRDVVHKQFTYDILKVEGTENNNSVVQYLLLGMLHAGIGVTCVNAFLMAINTATMSTANLMKRQKEVDPAVEKVAKKAYVNSAASERSCEQNVFD